MNKLLLTLSFLSLVIVAIGTAFMPHNQLFYLASSTQPYEIVREILAALLFVQILTKPPRNIVFRILSGLVAVAIGGWAIDSTIKGTMPLLDTLSLLPSALAIGDTALEVRPAQTAKNQTPHSTTNPLIA